jgi:hypothetical protein
MIRIHLEYLRARIDTTLMTKALVRNDMHFMNYSHFMTFQRTLMGNQSGQGLFGT